ncbi:uncharacterized protein SPPG_04358 [Spizellomyces punctatus DAOM BR117]|uniref:Uncharacterized protein n=1 Tax=Spizellomyces punctatus (strain DAOM BR117) TaxID=645134 RepID=A0A0L0HEX1_SPIPD|nr:hypothetical protein, variant [Spizellomyces punctatus DAOM BR117]XP_016608051.1 uncharacterized protein SPPG_04358 [Spizellomyces punctatus DAOM BR117]KND00011.1 hypothetical protein, variant [Spizellomyces punctatus DAOM BR117]KND00012.1 hypothetical protein SPPG_04358 [Spizellomyces punctatus DAOM BR117]|eukprot:XP_016608050.1 hypothetical protein, variant [Spizellomyces punctatus DAOM BR117]
MESSVGQALISLSQMTEQQHHELAQNAQGANALPSTPPLMEPLVQTEQARQRLIEQLHPHIPSEATSLLFDAGYETIDAIRTLNVNLTDPNNDLVSAEYYTKRTLKPGHRKLVIQYVTNPPYGLDPNDPANANVLAALGASPGPRKRRRMTDEGSPLMQSPPDLPTLLASLERHLAESPVTRALRKDVDYRVGVEHSRDGRGAEGVWKCLVCNSRPVTISLRNGGRQPQLSNVGTHLKTVKHTTALEQRNASAQFLGAVTNGDPSQITSNPAAAAAAAAAMAAAAQNAFQQHQHPGVKNVYDNVSNVGGGHLPQVSTSLGGSPHVSSTAPQQTHQHQSHGHPGHPSHQHPQHGGHSQLGLDERKS